MCMEGQTDNLGCNAVSQHYFGPNDTQVGLKSAGKAIAETSDCFQMRPECLVARQ